MGIFPLFPVFPLSRGPESPWHVAGLSRPCPRAQNSAAHVRSRDCARESCDRFLLVVRTAIAPPIRERDCSRGRYHHNF